MRHVSRFFGAVVLTFAVPLGGLASGQSAKAKAPADPPVVMSPMVLKDFQQRLEHYIKFQRGIEKDIGAKQKPVDDPQIINRKEETLAGTIRANRRQAKQGDIFAPAIAAEFRRLMNPQLKGRQGAEVKEELKEDVGEEADEGKPKPVPLKVNATYPEGNPLPTVPATILQALPTLPPDVEYRIVDRNLILRDVDANIIVDFIPRVIR